MTKKSTFTRAHTRPNSAFDHERMSTCSPTRLVNIQNVYESHLPTQSSMEQKLFGSPCAHIPQTLHQMHQDNSISGYRSLTQAQRQQTRKAPRMFMAPVKCSVRTVISGCPRARFSYMKTSACATTSSVRKDAVRSSKSVLQNSRITGIAPMIPSLATPH